MAWLASNVYDNVTIAAIGRKVRFHHTLPFMTKQGSQFGCCQGCRNSSRGEVKDLRAMEACIKQKSLPIVLAFGQQQCLPQK